MEKDNKPDAVDFKQDSVTFANRAPISSDKALIWIFEKSDGTTAFYTRNRKTGTWTNVGP